jgi:hypothetical protein
VALHAANYVEGEDEEEVLNCICLLHRCKVSIVPRLRVYPSLNNPLDNTHTEMYTTAICTLI